MSPLAGFLLLLVVVGIHGNAVMSEDNDQLMERSEEVEAADNIIDNDLELKEYAEESIDDDEEEPSLAKGWWCGKSRDCEMNDWGHWTHCSAGCGGGYQKRTRTVKHDKKCRGKECPSDREQTQTCNYFCYHNGIPSGSGNCRCVGKYHGQCCERSY